MDKIKDFPDRGIARFLEQFKNSPFFAALTRSYLNRVQELEDAIWEVILIRGIESSEGVNLDTIGKIVGRPRFGLIDSDYRVALRAEIRINRSAGTTIDVIDVGVLSIPVGFTFTYDEVPTATIIITVAATLPADPITFDPLVLFGNLVRTKAAGVRLQLIVFTVGTDNAFQFSDGTVDGTSATHGFSAAPDDTTGGAWVDYYSTSD